MPKEQNSFQDLVAEAPPAPSEGPVSLVGTLARSKDDGKFVLILLDGKSITLNTCGVKTHTVLGTSLGLRLVQVEVDADKVRDFASSVPLAAKLPVGDPNKPVILEGIQTGLHDLLKHGASDPINDYLSAISQDVFQIPGQGPVERGALPFALAAYHQAPAVTLAALQAYQAALSHQSAGNIWKTHADPRY